MTLSHVTWMENCFGLISSALQLLSMHPSLYSRKKIPPFQAQPCDALSHSRARDEGRISHPPPGSSHPAPLQQINPAIWVITDQTGTANSRLPCTRKCPV